MLRRHFLWDERGDRGTTYYEYSVRRKKHVGRSRAGGEGTKGREGGRSCRPDEIKKKKNEDEERASWHDLALNPRRYPLGNTLLAVECCR